MYQRIYDSPLGRILISSDGKNITGLVFSDGKGDEVSLPVLDEAERWLDIYFSGRDPGRTPPVRAAGSAFSRAVWRRIGEIPYGMTSSYGKIAGSMSPPSSDRAAGGAAGRNPVLLMIPCHRVICGDGTCGGYSAGKEIKRKLMTMEGCAYSENKK